MDRDHSLLGGIIVGNERHLLRQFEVRRSEIQVTRPYFYKQMKHMQGLAQAVGLGCYT